MGDEVGLELLDDGVRVGCWGAGLLVDASLARDEGRGVGGAEDKGERVGVLLDGVGAVDGDVPL